MSWVKIYKVEKNRFMVKGSPYLFIMPKATEAQQNMLSLASEEGFFVRIKLNRMVGIMALVKHFYVDRHRTIKGVA